MITLRSEDAALAVGEPRDDVLHEYALVGACLELADELVREVGELLDSALQLVLLHEGDVSLSEVVLLLLHILNRVYQGLREPCLLVDAALLPAQLEVVFCRREGRDLAHAIVIWAKQTSGCKRGTP